MRISSLVEPPVGFRFVQAVWVPEEKTILGSVIYPDHSVRFFTTKLDTAGLITEDYWRELWKQIENDFARRYE